MYNLCLISHSEPRPGQPYMGRNYSVKTIRQNINKDHIKRKLYSYPFLLKSNKLIDPKIGQQLTKLIKPLQNNSYNYRDPQFIKRVSKDNKDKPKLQEIICQYQHYRQYKQLKEVMRNFTKDVHSGANQR